ncbi:MAG: glycosyltransferase [Myxococcota bacterium]|nr:glycosyltransferase [Myxococcota bacterium]
MPRPSATPLVVAHLRRVWFKRTETFLHTTITAARRTRPLLIGMERANVEAFAVEAPVVELAPPGSLAARWNHWCATRLGRDAAAPLAGARARRALRRHGADLLHAHFGYTGVHALPLAARTGLPLVTTFYGEDVSHLGRDPSWRTRFALLFARGAAFLVEGPHMGRALVDLGCPSEKLHVQRIAIPCARYPFRARTPGAAPVRLFFCASFREKKGLRYALEAVARARAEHPGLVFRVGGDGPERAEVESLVARLGLGDCTELLGFLSHQRMIEEMQAADLFLQPSVTAANGDSEGGAPTTVLEAQACGLPVLATYHADLPHVVVEGESALLAPERDVERLAANLLTLLKSPERWASMGEEGRSHVERFHDAEGEVARLEARYAALVEEASCRRR